MSGHLSDPKIQARLADIARARKRQHEDDIGALMAHDWGRRLAYWLMYDLGGLQRLVFDATIKDGACAGQHMAHADGMRRLAIEFHNEIQELVPEAVITMQAEAIRAAAQAYVVEDDAKRSTTETGDEPE